MPDWVGYLLGVLGFVLAIVIWGLVQAATSEKGTRALSGCGKCGSATEDGCERDHCDSEDS